MVGRSCSESSGIGSHNDSRGAPYDKNFPVNPSRTLDDSAAVRKAPRGLSTLNLLLVLGNTKRSDTRSRIALTTVSELTERKSLGQREMLEWRLVLEFRYRCNYNGHQHYLATYPPTRVRCM